MDKPQAGRDLVSVRLSIRPDEEVEVPADEVPVLRHQGLIVEDEPAVSKTAVPKTPPASESGKAAPDSKGGA